MGHMIWHPVFPKLESHFWVFFRKSIFEFPGPAGASAISEIDNVKPLTSWVSIVDFGSKIIKLSLLRYSMTSFKVLYWYHHWTFQNYVVPNSHAVGMDSLVYTALKSILWRTLFWIRCIIFRNKLYSHFHANFWDKNSRKRFS